MIPKGHWRWWLYETTDYMADNRCRKKLVPSVEVAALIGLEGPFLLKRRSLLGLVEKSEPQPGGVAYVVDVLWSIKEDTSMSLFICESCTPRNFEFCAETLVSKDDLARKLHCLFGRDDYALFYSTARGEGTSMELVAPGRKAPLIVQDVDGDLVQLILLDAAYVQKVFSVLDAYASRTAHHV